MKQELNICEFDKVAFYTYDNDFQVDQIVPYSWVKSVEANSNGSYRIWLSDMQYFLDNIDIQQVRMYFKWLGRQK